MWRREVVLHNQGGQGRHCVLTGDQSQREDDEAEAREEEGQEHMQGTRVPLEAGKDRKRSPQSFWAHFRLHTPDCNLMKLYLNHRVYGDWLEQGQEGHTELFRRGRSGLLLKAGTSLAVGGCSPAPELLDKNCVDEARGGASQTKEGPGLSPAA